MFDNISWNTEKEINSTLVEIFDNKNYRDHRNVLKSKLNKAKKRKFSESLIIDQKPVKAKVSKKNFINVEDNTEGLENGSNDTQWKSKLVKKRKISKKNIIDNIKPNLNVNKLNSDTRYEKLVKGKVKVKDLDTNTYNKIIKNKFVKNKNIEKKQQEKYELLNSYKIMKDSTNENLYQSKKIPSDLCFNENSQGSNKCSTNLKKMSQNNISESENITKNDTPINLNNRGSKDRSNSQMDLNCSSTKVSSLYNSKDDFSKSFKNHKEVKLIDSQINTTVKQFEFNNLKNAGKNLREKMLAKLSSGQFRYLNQQIAERNSYEIKDLFVNDKESFSAYHKGFSQQISKWSTNPVDLVIDYIRKRGSNLVVADMGCGEAKIAANIKNTVYSFDVAALNKRVVVSDMANVPLENGTIDICVYCLSLMGKNLDEILCEGNRVMKLKGILLIVEVKSRFTKYGDFVRKLKKIGFKLHSMDKMNKMFIWFEFKKFRSIDRKSCSELAGELKPSIYCKR